MWSRVGSTVLVFMLAACSHGPLEPGAGNDPGTQTGIIVGGSVVATPVHANARQPTELTSDFQVVVSGSIGIVSTGTVTVTSASGAFPLVFVQDGAIGYWKGSAPGYDEVYRLDVVSPYGSLQGARVDGPDIHVFSQPEEGAAIEVSVPLRIAWERDDRADSAAMDIDSTVSAYLTDTGEYSVPVGLLAIANAGGLQHTLRVARTNSTMLRAGPAWSATVVNAIDVITPPPP